MSARVAHARVLARVVAVVVVVVVVVALASACGDTNAGRLCEPGDATFCGTGFQCLTFCDAASEPQSICTPSFGAEAGPTFSDEALIDGKPAFGQLGNVKHFTRDLRIVITGVKGVVLPLLEDVAGNIDVVGTDVECLAFPRLTNVAGAITIDKNAHLVKTELDALTTTHDLVVTNDVSLPTAQLPSLTSIAGDLTFTGDTAFTTLSAPLLTTVGACIDVDFTSGTCALPPRLTNAACCSTAPEIIAGGAACAACP
jgi:hypothetical protein